MQNISRISKPSYSGKAVAAVIHIIKQSTLQ
jgi:hypothetical protein